MNNDCNGGLHKEGMVRDAPWRKLGGDCDDNDTFARVHNNLLLHKCIYYFTPVHFLRAFAFFSTLCLKKYPLCFYL